MEFIKKKKAAGEQLYIPCQPVLVDRASCQRKGRFVTTQIRKLAVWSSQDAFLDSSQSRRLCGRSSRLRLLQRARQAG